MENNETVSQSEEPRKKTAILLGEEFRETGDKCSEYMFALYKRLDPVEMSIIEKVKSLTEEYEQCIAKILLKGFTLDECLFAYLDSKEDDTN